MNIEPQPPISLNSWDVRNVSNCCGARPVSNGDCDTEDFGICSDCLEHCEYIEESNEPDYDLQGKEERENA